MDTDVARKLELGTDNTAGPDACWPWTGVVVPAGYGSISVRGRHYGAHRVAWESVNGPIPDGLHACHHCDNPNCVNPAHIFVGTHAGNMRDKARKGRNTGGGKKKGCARTRGNSKLTEDQVREARVLVAAGHTRASIARQLGVSARAIEEIAKGRSWQHVV